MSHLEILQALLFLRGAEGVSLSDIYKICGKKDMEYAIYLLSLLELSLHNTPVQLQFIPLSKKYQIIIPPTVIGHLEKKELLKPLLSKAARATLACIILKKVNEEPITLTMLKKIRGSNVVKHLEELEKAGYISRENRYIVLTDKLLTEIDISAFLKEMGQAEKDLEKNF
ncbi:MAG: SMC-Scp complex subunit ScpB [Candidatus Helarchaeota archaeon]